jgi:hypothetical protein
MVILRIEHSVPNFDGWKQAFDSDPAGRKKSGVRRYQVLRPIDDPNFVMIDLEFDTASQAEALLAAMRVVRGRVEGTLMVNPQSRIVEAVETKVYWVLGLLPKARGRPKAMPGFQTQGLARVVWERHDGLPRVVQAIGGAWSAPRAISLLDSGEPQIVIDAAGAAHVAWLSNKDVYYLARVDFEQTNALCLVHEVINVQ